MRNKNRTWTVTYSAPGTAAIHIRVTATTRQDAAQAALARVRQRIAPWEAGMSRRFWSVAALTPAGPHRYERPKKDLAERGDVADAVLG